MLRDRALAAGAAADGSSSVAGDGGAFNLVVVSTRDAVFGLG
jgi:hypothetical protein